MKKFAFSLALGAALAFTPVLFAQNEPAADQGTAASHAADQSFDPHDLSGIWRVQQKAGEMLSKDVPPMTPWAQAKWAAAKPGIGPRSQPLGNDPIMGCDPVGFPRILLFNAYPLEMDQLSNRVLQFYDFFYTYRTIWTDGRPLPGDLEPRFYGYSVGKWDGDTFVVESAGFDPRTWLDEDGHPHSEDMKIEERYRRVDANTIELNMTLTDPKAYTRPWVSETKTLKRDTRDQMREDVCVPSDEEKYKEEVRQPAGTHAKN